MLLAKISVVIPNFPSRLIHLTEPLAIGCRPGKSLHLSLLPFSACSCRSADVINLSASRYLTLPACAAAFSSVAPSESQALLELTPPSSPQDCWRLVGDWVAHSHPAGSESGLSRMTSPSPPSLLTTRTHTCVIHGRLSPQEGHRLHARRAGATLQSRPHTRSLLSASTSAGTCFKEGCQQPCTLRNGTLGCRKEGAL